MLKLLKFRSLVIMSVKALILAGGFGKRLRPLTEDRPKPLIQVGSKTIIEWQIEWLRSQGIEEIILAVNKLSGVKIFEKLGDGSDYGVKIYYSVEKQPLGTGGAVKNAEKFLKDSKYIIVLNGDIITNMDLKPLIENLASSIVGVIALVPMRSPYGIAVVDSDGYITNFEEKPVLNYLINAGVYAFTSEIFNYLPSRGDIETTAFPKLASEKKLKAVIYRDIYWKSIDTIKDVEEVEKVVESIFSAKS